MPVCLACLEDELDADGSDTLLARHRDPKYEGLRLKTAQPLTTCVALGSLSLHLLVNKMGNVTRLNFIGKLSG